MFCFLLLFLILVLVFIDANKKLFQKNKRKLFLSGKDQADWELWTGHFSHSSLLARVRLGLCTHTHIHNMIELVVLNGFFSLYFISFF